MAKRGYLLVHFDGPRGAGLNFQDTFWLIHKQRNSASEHDEFYSRDSGRPYSEHPIRLSAYFTSTTVLVRSRAPICLSAALKVHAIGRYDIRNDYDHSCVQRLLSMKNQKIGTIVRYKRVVVLANCGHELPVFRAAKTKIVNMVGNMTGRMSNLNQRCV